MTRTLALLTLCLLAGPTPAADPTPLTPKQLADGWVKLFDGETTFGWPQWVSVKGDKLLLSAPGDRELVVPIPATHQGEFEIECHYSRGVFAKTEPRIVVSTAAGTATLPTPTEASAGAAILRYSLTAGDCRATLNVPASSSLAVTKFNFRPTGGKPIFDGKTLDGWKPYAGDPKRARSKFDVTAEGELRVTDGPGDLQTTSVHADFLLQFDCKTRGKNLNSGVFFRCLPGEYQAGYEAQVHNGFAGTDRTKPLDFGTGAIYRRVPARKVVSNDSEWFTMTLLAVGPTIRTWVNGEPVVNWTDDRPPDANARKGLRTAAGHLSIQGHDPTTDVLFRNLRVLDIK